MLSSKYPFDSKLTTITDINDETQPIRQMQIGSDIQRNPLQDSSTVKLLNQTKNHVIQAQ